MFLLILKLIKSVFNVFICGKKAGIKKTDTQGGQPEALS